ncbi:hypothetical protein EJB05_40587, partial [Eragrostis curvula]
MENSVRPEIDLQSAPRTGNVEVRRDHAPAVIDTSNSVEIMSDVAEIMHQAPLLMSNVAAEKEATADILSPSTVINMSAAPNESMMFSDQETPEAVASQYSPNEVDDAHGETIQVPQVGMVFKSEDDAYEMYNTYAGEIGFSNRKSNTRRRADKTIYQKHIVCSSQGVKIAHSSHETSKENAATRTSCKARIQFSVCRQGVWTVQKVVLAHNHYLASPNKRPMLRSQRHIDKADKHLIGQIREAGIKPAQVWDFFKQWYGGSDNVPFRRVDCSNQIGHEGEKYLEANDAQTLLNYLKNKQLEDPTFFYAIDIDKPTGRIANFFWVDGQAIMDYACFGYALSFDTTFQTNKVMPMKFQEEAIVVFNSEDNSVTCSCRKFEFIGILCKHALRILNINEVFGLPPQYILHRWTKYAKRGFICQKNGKHGDTLKAHAARISRKATSVAFKCSVSKELLDELEKAIDKLDLDADNSLLQRPTTSREVPQTSTEYVGDILKGKVSIKVPPVLKGKDPMIASDNREGGQDLQLIGSVDGSIAANTAIPNVAANMYCDSSAMMAPLALGGYTSLLLGVDQEAAVARKLHFDEASKHSTFKE